MPDPTIEPTLAGNLRAKCPPYPNTSMDDNITVKLDQNSFVSLLDNSYFIQALSNRGILRIDQELAMHPITRPIVMTLARDLNFPARFGAAMVRLGSTQVLTGAQGEIRASCRTTNVFRPVS